MCIEACPFRRHNMITKRNDRMVKIMNKDRVRRELKIVSVIFSNFLILAVYRLQN